MTDLTIEGRYRASGPWLTWPMPEDACPCLDHGCVGAGCKCFCHKTQAESVREGVPK